MAAIEPLGVTQSELHRLFGLRDGRLFWRIKRRSVNPGDLAGRLVSNGRWHVGVNGRAYKRSRLVWLYVHGVDTYPLSLDHVNRNSADDRVENLRPVTHAENQRNRAWGASKHRYVYLNACGTWRARVPDVGGRRTIGSFGTEAEAVAAVAQWEAIACV